MSVSNEELLVRVMELEQKLDAERKEVKPLLDLYNAGKIIGRILVIFGGLTVGVVTIGSSVIGWFNHK